MSAAVILGVALLGGLGSVGRLLLDGALSARLDRPFPYGTFAVNVTGSFALGLLVGAGLGSDTLRVVGGGLLGGYTTFSTWALESHRLAEDGQGSIAAGNFLVSLLLGLAAAWLGRELGLGL